MSVVLFDMTVAVQADGYLRIAANLTFRQQEGGEGYESQIVTEQFSCDIPRFLLNGWLISGKDEIPRSCNRVLRQAYQTTMGIGHMTVHMALKRSSDPIVNASL